MPAKAKSPLYEKGYIMTDLLLKLFVKDRKNTSDSKVRQAYAFLAGIVGIILNIFLFAGKLIIGILTASVAIIADAFNNISDAGSSVISMIGLRLAMKPVDKEHPLGHGRFEYISAFIVDMIIILVGFELFTSSVEKIINPVKTDINIAVFIFLGVAVLVKLWLALFYNKIGNKISASAIKASAADSLSDCVATLLVFITSLLSYFNIFSGVPLDGIAGIIVACFIAFTGFKAARETIDLLLGAPPSPEFVEQISEFYKSYPIVIGIHDLMVHDYGPGRKMVSFHAEVPSDCDINLAHEIIDQMERDMFSAFNCIVTIHLDPLAVNDAAVNEMRTLAEKCAKEVNESFSIHDFRMTQGEIYTNLIFDLVVPGDAKISCEDAEKLVAAAIHADNAKCYAVIKAENPYV